MPFAIKKPRLRAFKQVEYSPAALAHEGVMISACIHTFTHLQDVEDISFLKMHGKLSRS